MVEASKLSPSSSFDFHKDQVNERTYRRTFRKSVRALGISTVLGVTGFSVGTTIEAAFGGTSLPIAAESAAAESNCPAYDGKSVTPGTGHNKVYSNANSVKDALGIPHTAKVSTEADGDGMRGDEYYFIDCDPVTPPTTTVQPNSGSASASSTEAPAPTTAPFAFEFHPGDGDGVPELGESEDSTGSDHIQYAQRLLNGWRKSKGHSAILPENSNFGPLTLSELQMFALFNEKIAKESKYDPRTIDSIDFSTPLGRKLISAGQTYNAGRLQEEVENAPGIKDPPDEGVSGKDIATVAAAAGVVCMFVAPCRLTMLSAARTGAKLLKP